MPVALANDEEKIAEIKSVLRSLLISLGKEEVTSTRLNYLYKEEEGSFIRFWDYGYSSLPEFLQSIPDTCHFYYSREGKLCVRHVINEKSAHVASLVSKQKSTNKKKSNASRSSSFHYHHHWKAQRTPSTRPLMRSASMYSARSGVGPTTRPTWMTSNRSIYKRPSAPIDRPATPIKRSTTPVVQPVTPASIRSGADFMTRPVAAPTTRLVPDPMTRPVVAPTTRSVTAPMSMPVVAPIARPATPRPMADPIKLTTPAVSSALPATTVNTRPHTPTGLWSTIPASRNDKSISSAEIFDILVELRCKAEPSNNYGIRKCDILSRVANRIGDQASMYNIQSLNVHLSELVHAITIENDSIYFRYDLNNLKKCNNLSNDNSNLIDRSKTKLSLTDNPVYDSNIYVSDSADDLRQSLDSIDKLESYVKDNNINGINNELFSGSDLILEESNGMASLIKDRTKIRLQNLIENHPEGIWCSELPKLYKSEYQIHLEYEELGFSNITEFVAALPNIFLLVEPDDTKRQMLLSAKNHDSRVSKKRNKKTLASLYNFEDYINNDVDPVPLKLSPEVCQSLIPEGYMNVSETMDHILVSSLILEEYIEVIVSEIFTPSFFWVKLRKNKKKFNTLMNDLGEFYNRETLDFDVLKVPQVILQPGLNVACIYGGMWHRAIVKKVKPDGFVVVFFYDYGTVKTYNPNDLYFLHKKFSSLPAQAIPCGLHHVKPIGSSEWPTKVTNKFVHKVWDVPLICIITSINEENNTMMITLTDTSDDTVDVHINDWMVQNGLAEYGKTANKIPLHNICSYDEMELLRLQEEDHFSSHIKRKRSKSTQGSRKHFNPTTITDKPAEVINRCQEYINNSPNVNSEHIDCEEVKNEVVAYQNSAEVKDNSSISFCPNSNIELTSETSSVITLVKENTRMLHQTNTMVQAILLNMPSDKNSSSNTNYDFKSGSVSNKFSENQSLFSDPSVLNLDSLNKKLIIDLKKNASNYEISISEVNNNDNIKNDPNHKTHPEQMASSTRRSSVFSSVSQQSMFCNKMDQFQVNGLDKHLELKSCASKSFIGRSSTNSSSINQENNNNSTGCHENFCQTKSKLRQNDSTTEKSSALQFIKNDMLLTSNSNTTTVSAFTGIKLSEKLRQKPIHIFHLNNEGWIPSHEFVDAFTNLKDQRIMMKLLQSFKYDVHFKNLTRSDDPQLFSQLDKSELKVPRENNIIKSDFVLTLLPLRNMLQVLIKLDFLKSKMVEEAIPLIKKYKENAENLLLERYNNKILFDSLNVIVQYKEFKRSFKQLN